MDPLNHYNAHAFLYLPELAGETGQSLFVMGFFFSHLFQSSFFRTPCPVSVKQMEHEEDEDGITDENIKRNPDFQK